MSDMNAWTWRRGTAVYWHRLTFWHTSRGELTRHRGQRNIRGKLHRNSIGSSCKSPQERDCSYWRKADKRHMLHMRSSTIKRTGQQEIRGSSHSSSVQAAAKSARHQQTGKDHIMCDGRSAPPLLTAHILLTSAGGFFLAICWMLSCKRL